MMIEMSRKVIMIQQQGPELSGSSATVLGEQEKMP
jgi:hypothetical protein